MGCPHGKQARSDDSTPRHQPDIDVLRLYDTNRHDGIVTIDDSIEDKRHMVYGTDLPKEKLKADFRIQYKYDAFVCYNQDDPEDKRYVQHMIEELEGRGGLRLYVPGRDDLLDGSEHISNADQIERRCRRVIIVMSRSFLQSPFNTFQERFADALSRGARLERLIPIIREEGVVVPRILQGRNTYDLTNTDMFEDILARLTTDLRSDIEPETYLGIRSHNYLKDISFPRRFDVNDHTTPKQVIHFRTAHSPGKSGSPAQFSSETSQNTWKDIQILQKRRKNIKVPKTVTTFVTPQVHEEETNPKQVILPEDNHDFQWPAQLEYPNQPTTSLSQNQTPSQSDNPNSPRETAHMVDHASRISSNEPLTPEVSSNDQRTKTTNSENAEPQEPQDHEDEMGPYKHY